MDTCPTKRVKADNEQGFIVVNECDFDPTTQEPFEDSPPPEKAHEPGKGHAPPLQRKK